MATKLTRIVSDADLEPFFQGVDDFCEAHLPKDYPDEDNGGRKIFADPIEGYASLAEWEVSIIDTPLFQRLRSIHQLGLTFLVYPTLGYSRFEHTIGVLARLEQTVNSLKQNVLVRKDARHALTHLPEEKQLIAARLAAACHDLGHCIFSHVSESVGSSVNFVVAA